MREDYVVIRVSSAEKEELVKAAKEIDLPVSTWIRHAALMVAKKEVLVSDEAGKLTAGITKVILEKYLMPYEKQLKELSKKIEELR